MATITEIAHYDDKRGNRIVGKATRTKAAQVIFMASNCRLELADGVQLENCTIRFDCDGAVCSIGANSRFRGTICSGLNTRVVLGAGLSVTRGCYITVAEGATVSVGEGCMFAASNELRADDSHPIYDADTGMRVNPSRDIILGDHVWLGGQAVLLGGARVGSGSVLGFRTLLKGSVPENCIVVGVPGRVVRRGIRWEKTHLNMSAPHYFPGTGIEEPRVMNRRASPPQSESPARSIQRLLRKLQRDPQRFLADSRVSGLRWLGTRMPPRKPPHA